jgi:hypothetical protein
MDATGRSIDFKKYSSALWWCRRLVGGLRSGVHPPHPGRPDAGATKNQIPRLQNVFHARIFSGIVYFDTTLPEFVLDFLSIHS